MGTQSSAWSRVVVLAALATLEVACTAQVGDPGGQDDPEIGVSVGALQALPGLQGDDDLLMEAEATFAEVEDIGEGVGPVFNEAACGACHVQGGLGGAGTNIERRFGRFTGRRSRSFDPMASRGGSLRQLLSVGNFDNPNLPAGSRGQCDPNSPTLCCVPVEREPRDASVRNVGRLTTPLFGLGLVDAMPDSFFDGLASAQPRSIRGVVNRVPVLVPNPGDPSQAVGSTRVGRFGWKAGVPTLMQFSADAYVNEMGITTQSCFQGQSINDFALESASNGSAGSGLDGCDDLATRQPASFGPGIGLSSAQGAQVDDAVGTCDNGRTEIQDDVFLFTVFMTALAPLPRDLSDSSGISRGEPLFSRVGCDGCHVKTTFRTPSNPAPVTIGDGGAAVQVPGNFAFNPYSDFLTHDMGSLGDKIGNAGDSEATTRRMRTAPLWGIRFRSLLLHDGRATDIPAAIRAHDGQAANARDAFNNLTSTQRQNLVRFVRSL